MENASKALIMAGGILISVLVLSLIAYLYISFGAQTQEFSETINQRKLTEYNAQYTVYDGRKDLTVYDVVSIINTAHENNEKHKDDTEYITKYMLSVKVNGSERAAPNNQNFTNQINELIENNYETKYKCEVSFYNDTGKVKEVKISKVI